VGVRDDRGGRLGGRPDTNRVDQTIVVSATRLAMPAKDVASAITVITAEQLAERQATTLW